MVKKFLVKPLSLQEKNPGIFVEIDAAIVGQVYTMVNKHLIAYRPFEKSGLGDIKPFLTAIGLVPVYKSRIEQPEPRKYNIVGFIAGTVPVDILSAI